jgi:hypothetical protein
MKPNIVLLCVFSLIVPVVPSTHAQATNTCDGCTFTGSVTNVGTLILDGSSASLIAEESTLFNTGLVEEQSSGGLGFDGYGGGTTAFYNLAGGTYQFLTNSTIFINSCCSVYFFENQGLLWQNSGTNATTISVDMNNLGGTIEVDEGKLVLDSQGRSSNGTFNVASGAALDLTGGNGNVWAGLISGSGGGQVLLSSGTISAIPNLTLDFTNGLFNWDGGTFAGLITNAGTVVLGGPSPSILADQSIFVNEGQVQEETGGGLGLAGYGGGERRRFTICPARRISFSPTVPFS